MKMKKTQKYQLAALALAAFLLTESGGYVALYHNGTYYRTDTPVAALPAVDQALLEAGLPLSTPQEVTAALEDFCSCAFCTNFS